MLPKFPGDPPRDLSRPLERIKVRIDARLDGQRLDVALATVLEWRSRNSIHRLIADGYVHLEGRSPVRSRRVRTGDTITITVPPKTLVGPAAI